MGVLTEDGRTLLYSEKLACIRCGVSYPEITPRIFSFNSPHGACPACDGIGYAMTPGAPEDEDFTLLELCEVCHGARLRPESLSVKIAKQSIADVTRLSVRAAADFFASLKFTEREMVIAHRISEGNSRTARVSRERRAWIISRWIGRRPPCPAAKASASGSPRRSGPDSSASSTFSMNRPSACINATIAGCCRRCSACAISGNTVVVVEHDAETMLAADHILDMGPGAGSQGGHIIAQGTPQQVMGDPHSLTGQYLRGAQSVVRASAGAEAKGLSVRRRRKET